MDEAEEIMVEHCGVGNYRIEGWDEVVVDVEGYEHVNEVYEDFDDSHSGGASQGGSVTTDKVTGVEETTEIHVYYSCLRPVSPLR